MTEMFYRSGNGTRPAVFPLSRDIRLAQVGHAVIRKEVQEAISFVVAVSRVQSIYLPGEENAKASMRRCLPHCPGFRSTRLSLSGRHETRIRLRLDLGNLVILMAALVMRKALNMISRGM